MNTKTTEVLEKLDLVLTSIDAMGHELDGIVDELATLKDAGVDLPIDHIRRYLKMFKTQANVMKLYLGFIIGEVK